MTDKKKKDSRATVVIGRIGMAMIANALFLTLAEAAVILSYSPGSIPDFVYMKTASTFTSWTFLFTVVGFVLCLIGLFKVSTRKYRAIAMFAAILIWSLNFLLYFVPPSPEGLNLDELEETHRFIKYVDGGTAEGQLAEIEKMLGSEVDAGN